MTNRIQFKSFKMENVDHEAGTVEGYASTYGNVDKANDVVVPGAFKTALLNGPERVRFLWEHDRKSVIGVITEMREDSNGLYVKAQFATTQKAQETRGLMKMGAVDSFSIGYRVLREKKDSFQGKSVNMLQEIQLLEVSCVAWPCNVEARMTSIKSDIEDRFADLPLDQQELVSKFIAMLEAETKEDGSAGATVGDAVEEGTETDEAVEAEEKAEGTVVETVDEDFDLKAIADALELEMLAKALRDASK